MPVSIHVSNMQKSKADYYNRASGNGPAGPVLVGPLFHCSTFSVGSHVSMIRKNSRSICSIALVLHHSLQHDSSTTLSLVSFPGQHGSGVLQCGFETGM